MIMYLKKKVRIYHLGTYDENLIKKILERT